MYTTAESIWPSLVSFHWISTDLHKMKEEYVQMMEKPGCFNKTTFSFIPDSVYRINEHDNSEMLLTIGKFVANTQMKFPLC